MDLSQMTDDQLMNLLDDVAKEHMQVVRQSRTRVMLIKAELDKRNATQRIGEVLRAMEPATRVEFLRSLGMSDTAIAELKKKIFAPPVPAQVIGPTAIESVEQVGAAQI